MQRRDFIAGAAAGTLIIAGESAFARPEPRGRRDPAPATAAPSPPNFIVVFIEQPRPEVI